MVREAAAVAILALGAACGNAVKQAVAKAPASHAAPKGVASVSSAVVDPPRVSLLDNLVVDGPRVWPGARVFLKNEIDAREPTKVDLSASPFASDVCVRVLVRAYASVDAQLTDEKGFALAKNSGTDFTLGAKGPVCVRKGETLALTVSEGHVAYVALSPSAF